MNQGSNLWRPQWREEGQRCWDETNTKSLWRCRVSLKGSRAGPKANVSKEGASCNAVLSDFFLNVWAFLLGFLQSVLSTYTKILLLSVSSLHCFLEDSLWFFIWDSEENSFCCFYHSVAFYNNLCRDHLCKLLCINRLWSHRQCLPSVGLHHLQEWCKGTWNHCCISLLRPHLYVLFI